MAQRKSPLKKCGTKHCRNFAPIRQSGPRAGYSKGAKCHRCRTATWRKNNPMRDAYNRLKSHAKHRQIEFTITFKEFAKFAHKTKYLNEKGPYGYSLTVDRKNNLLGYIPKNIKAMSRAKNSEKRCKHDQIRMERGYAWSVMYGDQNPF